ncbi:lantibiotic dehydratase family protein [Robiginitalea sp. M366]|uniref:lantibiotic dehydratase family protein n=1 Tax=Robiginitalea aestuariiviva TaxID=3036903 RepID=UPI00240D67B6|nr:lantibiotic dehydratase family protein [Robiginitalea aestuariiviva]MDG1573286.1 lantibiotic dehydratase family protein [Robiginitalea aestuariiviva]
MNYQMPYTAFPKFVLRTPLFSVDQYFELANKPALSDEDYKEICSDPLFMEALYLASPPLVSEVQKWLSGDLTGLKRINKLKISIFKYYSRICSRCTPFGLFAGSSLGQINSKTKVQLAQPGNHKRHTRLDMNYLVALAMDLSRNDLIKPQILYYSNSSIYEIGEKLRYVEYQYRRGKRYHQSVSIDNNRFLTKLLKKSQRGLNITELEIVLKEMGVDRDDAKEYIHDLINNKVLVSEIEPSVVGPEFMDQILASLERMHGVEQIKSDLKQIDVLLNELDQGVGNELQLYQNIIDLLKNLGTEFNPKYVFQTDTSLKCIEATLASSLLDVFEEGLRIINKLSVSNGNSNLKDFRKRFRERFEEREIELSKCLDPELGIFYGDGSANKDLNQFVKGIHIDHSLRNSQTQAIQWNNIHGLLLNKIIDFAKNNQDSINLSHNDIKALPGIWDDLPDTFSCVVRLVNVGDKEKYVLSGWLGSSAGNLLGRFCHVSEEIHEFVNEIIEYEEKRNADSIVAEINHLPESRVGNVLMRPNIRNFEIPYLAKSLKPLDMQIPISDLTVSAKYSEPIKLKSKKYKREVKPRLTNAHNFRNKSLPIYHFLCDMQNVGLRRGLYLDFGPLRKQIEFTPRIEYKNIILHCATWNLKKSHVEMMLRSYDDDDKLINATSNFQRKTGIPEKFYLAQGDNELLVFLASLDSIRMFLSEVKNKEDFLLKEYLSPSDSIKGANGKRYSNEIILSFYKDQIKSVS